MKIHDHADLRGQTVELTDPENTQFVDCTFSDMEEYWVEGEKRTRPVNQVTIITNGYGREYLENCKGISIEIGA